MRQVVGKWDYGTLNTEASDMEEEMRATVIPRNKQGEPQIVCGYGTNRVTGDVIRRPVTDGGVQPGLCLVDVRSQGQTMTYFVRESELEPVVPVPTT